MTPESRNRLNRRIALAWLATCGLAACSNGAAPQAPTVVAPGEPVPLSYSTVSPAIGSSVGKRILGAGMSTTGTAGWLIFGPYIPLEPGDYEAVLVGFARPDHSGLVHVDVTAEKGSRVIAALELDAAALLAGQSPDAMIVVPFSLDTGVRHLEVRVRVDEKASLAVSELQIRSRSR